MAEKKPIALTSGKFKELSSSDTIPAANVPGNIVKVSSNDTTGGYLNGKLVVGKRIAFTENNDGGNETLTIDQNVPYVAKTAGYSVLNTDAFIDCTSGTFTVTMFTAIGAPNLLYTIKNSGTGVITIATTGGQTIDGVSTKTLYQNSTIILQSDGANWKVISLSFPSCDLFCYDTTSQTVAVANTFQDVTFNTNVFTNRWSHTLSTAVFTASETGIYSINVYAGANATGGAALSVELRVVKNTVAVPATYTEVAASQMYQEINNNNIQNVVSGIFAVLINAGESIKVQLTSTKVTGQIQAGVGSSTTKPSIKITAKRLE